MTAARILPSVCLVDHTGRFDVAQLSRAATALQIQVMRDLALPPPVSWGLTARVRAGQTAHPDEWVIGLFTDADQAGALGYHDETPDGLPLAKVFPFLDAGQPWTVTASHELCEMLADPLICRCVQSPTDGRVWALEVCDAVEQVTYSIDGVLVSDFVTPAYFEPPPGWQSSGLRLDHCGKVTKPYEILSGGYGQVLDLERGWQQIAADRRSAYRSKVLGRSERRAARALAA